MNNQIKKHQKYSKSAVLIKKLSSTSMSLNDIRTILTRELKHKTNIGDIFCMTVRDTYTIIIKTPSDDETSALLDKIEEIEAIKNITEITYKAFNQKKLIILGIPEIIEEDLITQKLQNYYNPATPITIFKKLNRNKKYQLIIELEEEIAHHLLSQQRINLGFSTCRISPYLSIVRCGNCQKFGHSQQNCTQQIVCKYCANRHESSSCRLARNQKKHRCVNCFGSPEEFPHSADSSECPAFHHFLQQRDIYAKELQSRST